MPIPPIKLAIIHNKMRAPIIEAIPSIAPSKSSIMITLPPINRAIRLAYFCSLRIKAITSGNNSADA